jgi:hypothetical protein
MAGFDNPQAGGGGQSSEALWLGARLRGSLGRGASLTIGVRPIAQRLGGSSLIMKFPRHVAFRGARRHDSI